MTTLARPQMVSHGYDTGLIGALITGCAGFPTDQPPQYGLQNGGTGDGSQNVAFIPNRPQPGASPAPCDARS